MQLLTYRLWPSARHLEEVTVTSFKWRSLEKWLADGHFKWRHLWKFTKKFFNAKWCKIAQNTKMKQKKFSKILRCDVTWSDGQMAMSLEVTSLLKWWSLPIEVTITCTSDEQMARAFDMLLKYAISFWCNSN